MGGSKLARPVFCTNGEKTTLCFFSSQRHEFCLSQSRSLPLWLSLCACRFQLGSRSSNSVALVTKAPSELAEGAVLLLGNSLLFSPCSQVLQILHSAERGLTTLEGHEDWVPSLEIIFHNKKRGRRSKRKREREREREQGRGKGKQRACHRVLSLALGLSLSLSLFISFFLSFFHFFFLCFVLSVCLVYLSFFLLGGHTAEREEFSLQSLHLSSCNCQASYTSGNVFLALKFQWHEPSP